MSVINSKPFVIRGSGSGPAVWGEITGNIARVSDYPCAYRDGYTNGYGHDNINFIGRNY